MEEPYWWYVLFVRTNSERRVVRDVTDFVKASKAPYEIEAFIPESEVYYRNKKFREIGKQYSKRPLFPGYVFVEANIPSKDFIELLGGFIYDSTDVIKLLRYGDSGEAAVALDERRRFEYLFRGKRCLEHSQGFIEGDKITIESGPLKGREGSIKYINRHNHCAKVEFKMFDKAIMADVALEIVKKV